MVTSGSDTFQVVPVAQMDISRPSRCLSGLLGGRNRILRSGITHLLSCRCVCVHVLVCVRPSVRPSDHLSR